jgi:hypothetical protein
MMEEEMSSYLDQINPKNVLNAMGMGPRNVPSSYYFTENLLPTLAIFSAGIIVGAAVAVLVTPKSGRELRGDISRKATELTGTVKNRFPELAGGRGESENGKRAHQGQQQPVRTSDI